MTRRELLRRVDTAEYGSWLALYELEADERKRAEMRQKASAGRGRHRR